MANLKSSIIYDTSAMVNVGSRMSSSFGGRAPQKVWNVSGFPTGGLYFFMRTLLKDLNFFTGETTSIIVAMDSRDSLRRGVYPEYKGNRRTIRVPGRRNDLSLFDPEISMEEYRALPYTAREKIALKNSVSIQLSAIKEIMSDFGIPCVELDGIEADDIIYSVAIKNPNLILSIRADDHDLVDTKLFNQNVKLNGITKASTITGVRVGQLLDKIENGCDSDNIPSLYRTGEVMTAMDAFKGGIVNPFSCKSGSALNLEPLKELGLSPETCDSVGRNVYCVLPFVCDIELKPTIPKNLNYDKLHWWFSVYGLAQACKTIGREVDLNLPGVREKREENREKASKYLSDYLYSENLRYK